MESLAAIEGEIERLSAARDALRALVDPISTTEDPPAAGPIPMQSLKVPLKFVPHPARRTSPGKAPAPGETRPAGRTGQALRRLLQHLAAHGPMGSDAVAKALGIGLSTARNVMGRNRDLFDQPGYGLWGLTEAGRAAAATAE